MMLMKITAEGTGVTAGAASAVVAIPVDASGIRAEKVYLTAGGLTYVLPGYASTVATTSSVIVGANSPILLDVRGLTHIAYIEGVAAQALVITPVD